MTRAPPTGAGHISKYVCKIGKHNQRGIIFSCNTILSAYELQIKKIETIGGAAGGGCMLGVYVCMYVFPLLIVNRYVGFHLNAYRSLF